MFLTERLEFEVPEMNAEQDGTGALSGGFVEVSEGSKARTFLFERAIRYFAKS